MSEATEFTKNTGIPLDVDIEEQVPVKKLVVDSFDEETETAKVSIKTVLEKRTVRYMHVPKTKHRCKDGEHVFRIFNRNKYLFACTLCPFVRKVFPTTYRFDRASGKLIHRITGQAV